MTEETEKSNAGSAIVLAIVVTVVALYSVTYGLQTLQWIDARRCASVNPWLAQKPQPLPAVSFPAAPPVPAPAGKHAGKAAPATSTQITSYTYQFTVPWTGKFKQQPSQFGDLIRFDSGQVVVFIDPDAQLNTLTNLRQSTDPGFAPFRSLIDAENISSNYDLFNAVYTEAPADLSPVMSYAAAVRARTLLLTKLSFGFDLERDFYSFQRGGNKGFQFGDPAKGPVAVRAFTAHDKQLRLLFAVYTGSGAQIAQQDIDMALSTLQDVSMGSAQ